MWTKVLSLSSDSNTEPDAVGKVQKFVEELAAGNCQNAIPQLLVFSDDPANLRAIGTEIVFVHLKNILFDGLNGMEGYELTTNDTIALLRNLADNPENRGRMIKTDDMFSVLSGVLGGEISDDAKITILEILTLLTDPKENEKRINGDKMGICFRELEIVSGVFNNPSLNAPTFTEHVEKLRRNIEG